MKRGRQPDHPFTADDHDLEPAILRALLDRAEPDAEPARCLGEGDEDRAVSATQPLELEAQRIHLLADERAELLRRRDDDLAQAASSCARNAAARASTFA